MKRLLITAITSALILSGAGSIHAQGGFGPGGGMHGSPFGEAEGPTFSLEFEGGLAKDLISAIEDASGERPNLIVARRFEDVVLPPIHVNNVTTRQLFQALNVLMDPAGGHVDPMTGASYSAFQEVTPGIWSLSPMTENDMVNPFKRRTVRVFYVGDYLKKYEIEEITTAIQTAFEMMAEKDTPKLKFHPATKLLMTSVTEQEFQVLGEVMGQLDKGLHLEPLAQTEQADR